MRGAKTLVLTASVMGAAAGLAACGGRIGHGHSHGAPVGAIGVNAYLWRATLDTLAFMPLASADPYGGVEIGRAHV